MRMGMAAGIETLILELAEGEGAGEVDAAGEHVLWSFYRIIMSLPDS